MATFIFIYKGPVTDMKDMTEEQSKVEIAAWNQWFEKTGSALLDVGQPMANGISLVDDGTAGTPCPLGGYSIVEAADMAGAKALAEGHPVLKEGKGKYSIDIFELLPVPM